MGLFGEFWELSYILSEIDESLIAVAPLHPRTTTHLHLLAAVESARSKLSQGRVKAIEYLLLLHQRNLRTREEDGRWGGGAISRATRAKECPSQDATESDPLSSMRIVASFQLISS